MQLRLAEGIQCLLIGQRQGVGDRITETRQHMVDGKAISTDDTAIHGGRDTGTRHETTP